MRLITLIGVLFACATASLQKHNDLSIESGAGLPLPSPSAGARFFLSLILTLALSGCAAGSRYFGTGDPVQIVCSQSQVAGLMSIFNGGSQITSLTIYHPEELKGIRVKGDAAGCPGFDIDGTAVAGEAQP